jgi:hypothetical protein
MPQGIPVSHCPGSNSHILVMSPEPKISCFPLPKTPFKTYPVVEGFCPTLPQKYQPKLWLCIPSAARRPNRKKIAAKSLSVNLGLVDHL